MFRIRQVVVLMAAVAVAAASGVGLAPPVSAASEDLGSNCVIVLGKAAADVESPVLARACGADIDAATREATAEAAAKAPLVGLGASVAAPDLLMEWFWNANNSPPKLTRVVGYYGPCDSQGYVINIYDDWANNISGFNTSARCNYAVGYDLALQQGDYETWERFETCICLRQKWIGSKMNDRVESFKLRRTQF